MTLEAIVKGKFYPGLFIDGRDQLALALLSEDAVGVSVSRYDVIPTRPQIQDALHASEWVALYRHSGPRIFLLSDKSELSPRTNFHTPQESEAMKFAIELALHAWPNWERDLLKSGFQPRFFVPVMQHFPEA